MKKRKRKNPDSTLSALLPFLVAGAGLLAVKSLRKTSSTLSDLDEGEVIEAQLREAAEFHPGTEARKIFSQKVEDEAAYFARYTPQDTFNLSIYRPWYDANKPIKSRDTIHVEPAPTPLPAKQYSPPPSTTMVASQTIRPIEYGGGSTISSSRAGGGSSVGQSTISVSRGGGGKAFGALVESSTTPTTSPGAIKPIVVVASSTDSTATPTNLTTEQAVVQKAAQAVEILKQAQDESTAFFKDTALHPELAQQNAAKMSLLGWALTLYTLNWVRKLITD